MTAHISVGDLIGRSIQQYSEIAELLGNLKNQLEDNSTKEVATRLERFNQLSRDALLVDAQIEDQLRNNQAQLPAHVIEKLVKRKEVQQDTLQLIEQTVAKASTIKSYLASEYLSVRKGRNAISGYKSRSRNQGKIVNKNF